MTFALKSFIIGMNLNGRGKQKMSIFLITVLAIGILAMIILVSYGALKMYSNHLVKSGKWLNTDRPEWLEWLLDNLT